MARLEQPGRTMNPSGAGRVGAALRRSGGRGLMTYAAYLPAQADRNRRGDTAAMMAGITDAEVRGRIRRVQQQLEHTGRAAVICFGVHRDYWPGDVRYLSRHSCTDEETAYVFVPRQGES